MVVGLVVVQGLCLPVGPNQLFLLRQGYNWGTRNLFFCVRISWFGWGYLFQWLRTTLTDVAWMHQAKERRKAFHPSIDPNLYL